MYHNYVIHSHLAKLHGNTLDSVICVYLINQTLSTVQGSIFVDSSFSTDMGSKQYILDKIESDKSSDLRVSCITRSKSMKPFDRISNRSFIVGVQCPLIEVTLNPYIWKTSYKCYTGCRWNVFLDYFPGRHD